MHLKLKSNSHTHTLESRCQKRANRQSLNMASSLVNDDEDNTTATTTTRTTQQQQQQQTSNKNNNNCLNQQNNNTSRGTSSSNNNNSSSNTSANANLTNKMQGNEAKVKKENLQQRKLELEKLLNEKNWLLQQLQKQETEILNGNFEYMNFNDFIQDLASQYKQEQGVETGSSLLGLGGSQFSGGEEAILRRKPLTAKENQQQQQHHHHHHNALHRRQSEISNRSSEYDNYPHQDNLSTHSEGGGVGVGAGGNSSMTMQHAQQAQQQYNPKSALKKRSATVAGTTQKSTNNLQMVRHQHLDHQQLLYKQQQQQQHYHHPQQHLFKHHMEHHQVLMPHLQYATQKFYYTTLQAPTTMTQQQEYGRYIAQPQHHHSAHNAQNQTSPSQSGQKPHNQMPSCSQATTTTQQHLLMTPPHGGGHMDNISLYSLNSNNVATLHRQAEKQQPVIVQCDKYYLSPTTHHVSHNDGGGFIKSSQNIKEYISPINSPQQQLMAAAREKRLASQGNNVRGTVNTPVMDIISLAPSYMSMESVEYMQPIATNIQQSQNQQRWRSQSNLPPSNLSSATAMVSADVKSYSSDMLNNNQYYNTNLNPPPAPASHPPNVTQVKPFKPLDEISLASYSSESQKKPKAKQWLESSLDGPVIRQTPNHGGEDLIGDYLNNNNNQQRSKLSSHSLNTSRHYSMSAAQAKPLNSPTNHHNAQAAKLSQSTSYLNQLVETTPHSTLNSVPVPSISQAYNVEATSPQTPVAYKLLPGNKPPARPPLYINAGGQTTASPTTGLLPGALSPDIRVESPKNVTVVQPATFQPYKEVTKPFEMSDFYKYSTKYRQKENNNTAQDN